MHHYPQWISAVDYVPLTPQEWEYGMRRDMQEIIPGLFLGPYAVAMKSKFDYLQSRGITHIVCIRQEVEKHFVRPCFPNSFQYLVLNIADSYTENIIQYFPQVKCFIDDCLARGGKVLVHGNAGISRSAALVIAYLMEKFGLSYRDALEHVQKLRFCVSPNESFASQLREYEPIYRARQVLQQGQTSHSTGELKRKHLDEDMETSEKHFNTGYDVT